MDQICPTPYPIRRVHSRKGGTLSLRVWGRQKNDLFLPFLPTVSSSENTQTVMNKNETYKNKRFEINNFFCSIH
jgi:hypothetical protein